MKIKKAVSIPTRKRHSTDERTSVECSCGGGPDVKCKRFDKIYVPLKRDNIIAREIIHQISILLTKFVKICFMFLI